MKITNQQIITKIHLVISVFIVVPVAIVYGFVPDSQFDIHLNTIDEHNQFKAIMGLYLGFSVLWVLGILKSKFLKTALLSNYIFFVRLGLWEIVELVG